MELQSNYGSQTTMPRSTGQAVRELPGQYFKVLTRPSVATFAEEKGKASWRINWLQFIGLGLIGAVLQSIGLLISPPNFSNMAGTAGISHTTLLTITIVFLAIFELILTPVSFLAAGGILFLIAKAFGGNGIYREQIYTMLLFGVPLVIVSYLLSLIPGPGAWLLYLPHIYSLVLLILSLRAVHQFGRGKAR
ncbi:MAG: YIP1 family protein [Ktedonobacteraceae bacterium]|nr:YIP1 family protein [Ktedonobacteraceae bacterium]MBV9617164.1 YIP1 family protein [Ktedonobacteraceae bacterium]